MKKMISAAILAAATFAPALAADMPAKAPAAAASMTSPLSAEIGVYFGETSSRLDSSGTIFKDHPTLYGGMARANWWFAPSFSLQGDLEGERANRFKSFGEGEHRKGALYGGHLAWRDPQRGAIGGFGGVVDSNDMIFIGVKDFHESFFGAEGQLYLGNFTLYGQAGGMERISGVEEAEPDHLWFARGVGRYFVTPNDRLQAEFAFARGKAFGCSVGCSDIKLPMWGASFEHRFDNSPLAIFVQYSGFRYSSRFDFESDGDSFHEHQAATEHIVMGGVKLYFGEGTLLANDRSGTTFDMPQFIRALPWATLAGP